MEILNTNDELTKRILIALYYVNRHCTARNVVVNGQTGDVTFGKST